MRTVAWVGLVVAVAAGLLATILSQAPSVDGNDVRSRREPEVGLSARNRPVESEFRSGAITAETKVSRVLTTPALEAVAAGRLGRSIASASNDRLATERLFLAGDDVDSAAVGALLQADERFVKVLERMERDMAGDPDASELADAYREGIASQLTGLEGLALGRLACGLRICAATFEDASDEAGWEAWRQRFEQDVQTPHHVFVERRVPLSDGTFERRIVYSTDPGSAGVLVRVGPGG